MGLLGRFVAANPGMQLRCRPDLPPHLDQPVSEVPVDSHNIMIGCPMPVPGFLRLAIEIVVERIAAEAAALPDAVGLPTSRVA